MRLYFSELVTGQVARAVFVVAQKNHYVTNYIDE